MKNKVILKLGKEKAIKNRHHWIFSGAIAEIPEFENGSFMSVWSEKGEFLGSAYFNKKSAIIGRMVSFDQTPPLDAIKKSLDSAIAYRSDLFRDAQTNVYRLVNGEGDSLPGLIIDKYNDVLVVQIGTLGMELQRTWLVDYLVKNVKPQTIYEKSLLPTRKEEGLPPVQQHLHGPIIDEVRVLENGLQFNVSILEGQKTGFFLDHREMRQWVRQLSLGKRVLNCFSYTGAFSVYAAAGGAERVDSVEISEKANLMAQQNMILNGFPQDKSQFYTSDVFDFLREKELNYNLVIIDPPAFAKRQKDIIAACRGYKDINRIAIQKMPAKSMLLTCSCSYHVDTTLFKQVIFQASHEAGRKVRIMGSHRMAPDHPINIYHPESDYLKSLLLYIE